MKNLKSERNWFIPAIFILALYSATVGTIWLITNHQKKIAYVNSGDLLKRYKGAVEANKKFEEESKKWQDNIQTLQAELDSLNFLFVKNSDQWSLSKKKEFAGFAKKKETDLNRYSQAIQQKASERQQELLTPVLVDINNKIADYAREKGYDMILGTADGNIVYAEEATNVTEQVLAVLNQ